MKRTLSATDVAASVSNSLHETVTAESHVLTISDRATGWGTTVSSPGPGTDPTGQLSWGYTARWMWRIRKIPGVKPRGFYIKQNLVEFQRTKMEKQSMANYKAGIIGLGFIGGADPVSGDALGQKISSLDGTHFVSLSENPRVEVVAGSTRDAGRRERFAERSGARTYADWREMLDTEALDIVSVATYSPVHAEITVECAERGIRAIYCEKPIATRLPDAERMLAACEKSGSLLAINHNRRFDSNYRRLRDLISNGGFGEIISVNLQWAGGRLGNVGTHNFDAAAMLTSSRIESVSGTLDLAGKPDCRGPDFQDPGGWGILRLASGAKITVDAADYATTPYLTIVNGTKGRARAGLFKTEFVLEFVDGTSETWEKPPIRPSGMDTCVSEIVAWMDDGTPFSHPAEEALNTFEAIVAFHASHARNGGWVDLPLKGEDRDWVVNTG